MSSTQSRRQRGENRTSAEREPAFRPSHMTSRAGVVLRSTRAFHVSDARSYTCSTPRAPMARNDRPTPKVMFVLESISLKIERERKGTCTRLQTSRLPLLSVSFPSKMLSWLSWSTHLLHRTSRSMKSIREGSVIVAALKLAMFPSNDEGGASDTEQHSPSIKVHSSPGCQHASLGQTVQISLLSRSYVTKPCSSASLLSKDEHHQEADRPFIALDIGHAYTGLPSRTSHSST
mmetsp:Transcript_10563/g.17272  ORF Transcript_10563/g.17272 Transcript_10563/m.17272 type:complete len:233 (+) Transcript_10563:1089-1787(+)